MTTNLRELAGFEDYISRYFFLLSGISYKARFETVFRCNLWILSDRGRPLLLLLSSTFPLGSVFFQIVLCYYLLRYQRALILLLSAIIVDSVLYMYNDRLEVEKLVLRSADGVLSMRMKQVISHTSISRARYCFSSPRF